ncbi:MAG: 50S ribosomal protein L18 [Candidatus Omnitrophica bacterium]|nr:50S ribosomal protein L18 [Candidatus Omnitrophota bacterium]MDD5352217.1 50S ribosomal protein L18 [Candidatus Omnitrophota bacterium]MDD5549815.1 50S ribosomal protein L18 [Candidatus Omnitrophota bacterium]
MHKKNIKPRERRHTRIRKKIFGTQDKPRLNVYKSLKNLFVQLVDDEKKSTLLFISTLDKEFKEKAKYGGNVKAAALLGEIVARKAKEKNINKVVFDRGGYLYHGRVKTLAESLRKGGLEF